MRHRNIGLKKQPMAIKSRHNQDFSRAMGHDDMERSTTR
jgi:hypothetical protein